MCHGYISFLTPLYLKSDPFVVTVHKILIPFLQFFPGNGLPETPDFLCVQIHIGHLYSNLSKIFFFTEDPTVTKCLRPVYRHRFFHLMDISVNTFDLINTGLSIFCKNTISSSFYLKDHIFIFCIFFQGYFCLIMTSHLFLYFSVDAASLQHCFLVCAGSASAGEITASQYKFYQVSDRNANYRFFHFYSSYAKNAYPM